MNRSKEAGKAWFGAAFFVMVLLSPFSGRSQSVYPAPRATAAGYYHSMALKSDGTVWTWGYNLDGELGNNDDNDSSVPVPLGPGSGSTNVAAISCGQFHSMSLGSNGTVWAWGLNEDGQLGNGTITDSLVPVAVTGLSGVTQIASGGYHNLALSNGIVWGWGYNSHGELGNGTTGSRSNAVRVTGLANASAVAGGEFHSMALSNGTVWAWGHNGDGQLGNGTTNDSLVAVPVTGLSGVTQIACGGFHSLALSNGYVWAWGNNNSGELGNSATNGSSHPVLVAGLSNITSIAGGEFHSLAVKSDGTVWAWGYNDNGALGDGTTNRTLVPLQVRYLRSVISVSAGSDHSLALRSDGTVWSWGVNDYGQIGDDSVRDRWRPVAVEILTILAPGTPNPVARATRFDRGHSLVEIYCSFVIPLDGEKGVKLNPIGGNADVLFKTNAWANTLYHYNNSFSGPDPLPFNNPIVAFGRRVGGSSLYYNQTYNFGVYAGDPAANTTNAIGIEVYNRADFSLVATYYLSIPSVAQTNVWANFLTNGFTLSTNAYGLTTKLYYAAPQAEWGTFQGGNFVLSHTATESNYFYAVQIRGQAGGVPLVAVNGSNWWSRLYTLDFETRPPWRAVFIDQPQFDGQPLPSIYQGKSVEELLAVSAVVTNAVSLTPSNCLNIDQSPELRRHPILDQFVADMGRDPLALVNYVVNEIGLVDAIDYNDNGSISETSINLGGVNRSALGTYLEGQGSPAEQCALLVYLLRQAGMPACYIYPPHNGLKMLDARMSRLLRMQFRGLVNDAGTPIVPQLIPVNYPWVAVYASTNNGVSTNWIHVYPWLKDTEIIEGLDLYKFMPSNYDSAFKWVRQYCLGDTNIMSLATDAETPLEIFPKFLQQTLLTNYPGISVDEIGARIQDRRHYYSRWTDLPTPTSVTNACIAIESLGSSSITNVFPKMTNIFDTVSVEVYSVANSNSTRIATGDMQMVDLHNRKFLLRHERITGTSQHRMILSLAPYRPDTTNPIAFASVHFLDKNDTNVLKNVVTTNTLNSGDDYLQLRIVHKRHRSLTDTNDYGLWDAFPGLVAFETTTVNSLLRKGDMAAICLDVGRVSRKMLDVYAQEHWQMEQMIQQNPTLTNSIASDVSEGTTAYLMGMSYYERLGRFQEAAESLHKIHAASHFYEGLGKISPKRGANGALTNGGDIILIQPGVDMVQHLVVLAGNKTLRPDEGADYNTADYDYTYLWAADGSAQEHQTINTYFKEADAISTAKLLQIAQKGTNSGGPGMLVLNKNNYFNYGTSNYNGKLSTNDAGIWQEITNTFATSWASNFVQVFITPGPQTNNSGSYKGMGALILDQDGFSALISGNMVNGGFGSYLADAAFSKPNIPNRLLILDQFGDVSESFAALAGAIQAEDIWTPAGAERQQQNAANLVFGDSQTLGTQQALSNSGITGGTDSQNYVNYVGVVLQSGILGPDSNLRQPGELTQDPVSVVSGEFYVRVADLALPGPMPLTVARNYSSQNLAPNQFGYGWKLNYMPFLSVSANTNVIYAAEPDGAVIAYVRTGTNTVWLPTNTYNPRLSNRTTAGIGSTANAFNGRIQTESSGTTNFYKLFATDGSVRTFQVMSFTNIFTNSRPFLVKWQDARSNYWTLDYGTNATQPDFGYARRIQCSNGSFLGYYFDYFGHVTEAYTADGRRVRYKFDHYGDLTAVILPDGSQVSYEYEHKTVSVSGTNQTYSTHLLLKELKPNGRQLINVYDDQRRVTNQLSTSGQDLNPVLTATFVYSNNFKFTNGFANSISGYTIVKDAYNNATRYDYIYGLITSITNPLGQAVVQDWYMPSETNKTGYYPRSLEKTIDRRGLITQYQYDAYGNLTNTTITGDLSGNGNTNEQAVTSRLYDTNNLVTLEIDPSGNTNKYSYTNNWLLSRTEFYPSNSTAANWVTNLLSYCSVTSIVNNGSALTTNLSFGLARQLVRAFNSPDAATTETAFDGRGFKTQQTAYTGTTDPNVTLQFFHNGRDELVEQTDVAGRRVHLEYDDLGRQTAKEIYEAGQSLPVSWEYLYYNDNGELVWSDGPAYDPEDYVFRDYDGAGRKILETHWRAQARTDGSGVEAPAGDDLYASTFLLYDLVGNLIRSTSPLGVVVTNTFDAIGQRITSTVTESNGTVLTTSGFAYEAGGQVAFETNGLGGIAEKRYTSRGQPVYQLNPDGSRLSWRYYADGRPATNFLSNGAYWRTVYDDPNRRTTKIYYSAANAPLATNVTELDRRGNVVRTVDAAGFASTATYDGLDRPKSQSGPQVIYHAPAGAPDPPSGSSDSTNQQFNVFYYDAAGVVTTNVNALGEKTITYMDAAQRKTRSEIRDASNGLIRETSWSYSADHHGVTQTNGSGANAIVSTVYSDHDGHAVLNVQYPVAGSASVLQYSWSRFDVAGNPVESRQYSSTNGAATLWATNAASFDGLNRMVSEMVRDGATTTFTYDAAGNPLTRTMPGGTLIWHASYNNAGQKLQEYDLGGGGLSTRTNSFSYYASNSPFAGLLQTQIDGRRVTNSLAYDDWLRLGTNTYSGSLPEQNASSTVAFDVRSLPLTLTERFATNTTGSSAVINRTYDAYRQVLSEIVQIDGQIVSDETQTWDAAGRRDSFGIEGFGENMIWQADGLLSGLRGPTGNADYSYTTAGLLASRALTTLFDTPVRTTTITSRDGTGHLLAETNRIGNLTGVGEVLAWTGDGRLSTHSVINTNFTDNRAYFYQDLSRRLGEERQNIDASHRWTNSFTFDNGAAGGVGALTKVAKGSSPTWSGALDGLSRITTETNSTVRRTAYGTNNGPAAVSVFVDGAPMPVTMTDTQSLKWQATLDLTPGSHQLIAAATHPSTIFTAYATNTITAAITNDTVLASYDFNGNITARVWKSANGQTNRTQAMAWDGHGRLFRVSERDGAQNGSDTTLIYDALNRLLRVVEAPVASNVTNAAAALTIDQYFDPNVAFLVLGVATNGDTTWKIMGPDLNGIYGGLNGLGGFEAIVPAPELFCPIVSDARGNLLVVNDAHHGGVLWNKSRPTGYGAVPGYRPPALGHGASLVECSAWGGKWMIGAGFYIIGLRALEADGGQWLSPDPLGHASSDGLMDYCAGDPINNVDIDGRCIDGSSYRSSDWYKMGQKIAWGVEEGADAVWNAALISIKPDNVPTRTALQMYGNPFLQTGAYEPSSSNDKLQRLSADLGEAGQGVMQAYGALREKQYSPPPERETQWSAPVEPRSYSEPGEVRPTEVMFGQRRIDPEFSEKPGVPDYLAGRPISDVAADLRAGRLSPFQLPILAFEHEGQLVGINNRTLGALSEAELAPVVIRVQPSVNELGRLFETPLIGSPIPGPQIPVTLSRSDLTILRVIQRPR